MASAALGAEKQSLTAADKNHEQGRYWWAGRKAMKNVVQLGIAPDASKMGARNACKSPWMDLDGGITGWLPPAAACFCSVRLLVSRTML